MKNCVSEFSVERMASVLGVSRSGFYASDGRPQSKRAAERLRFDLEVRSAFAAGRGVCGSQKVQKVLGSRGIHTSRKRVVDSMKRQTLTCKPPRRFTVTTNSKHDYSVAPNLLNRQFSVASPDTVWVTDITYLPSQVGWLYLSVFIDLFSRLVVGWCVSASLDHIGPLTALRRAIWRRKPGKGTMVHSDRGVQFCCHAFREAVTEHGMIQSMSRKGNCWDNAVAESFFRTLKNELVYRTEIHDLAHAEELLFDYIEVFYNRQRLHATLGYVAPADFERVKPQKCS
jgi:putative transposase